MACKQDWLKVAFLLLVFQSHLACIYAAFPTPTYGIRYRRIFEAQADSSNMNGGTMLGRELAPAVSAYYQSLGESGGGTASSPAPAASSAGSSSGRSMLSLPGR